MSVLLCPAWSPCWSHTAGWGCWAQDPTEPLELHCWAGKSSGQSLVSEGRWHCRSPGDTDTATCCCGLVPPTAMSVVGPACPAVPLPVLAHFTIHLRSVCVADGTVRCSSSSQRSGLLGQCVPVGMAGRVCPLCWRLAGTFTAAVRGGASGGACLGPSAVPRNL